MCLLCTFYCFADEHANVYKIMAEVLIVAILMTHIDDTMNDVNYASR